MIIIFEIPLILVFLVIAALLGAEIGGAINVFFLIMLVSSVVFCIGSVYKIRDDPKDWGWWLNLIGSVVSFFVNGHFFFLTLGKSIKAYDILIGIL